MEILGLLYGTVLLRPYVFIFLAFYLAIAVLHMGWARALMFTIVAYLIAFMAEYSSTRNGFPFGFYTYIDLTRHQELWISNVPFMDSLSFTFLSFISYMMAKAPTGERPMQHNQFATDLAGLVDFLAGQSEVGGGRIIIPVWNNGFSITARCLNFPPLLRGVIFVGQRVTDRLAGFVGFSVLAGAGILLGNFPN